ncbi:MAG: hypothetical protein EOO38_03825 [Cytophagaceae bacterium]|nr:MAG: hypothetical protein EOO38_03825 [Cytophagaceae bacterium]
MSSPSRTAPVATSTSRSVRPRSTSIGAAKSGLRPHLWRAGTNFAKDLIYGRLHITPGRPGYTHFSKDVTDEYYAQMGWRGLRGARCGQRKEFR